MGITAMTPPCGHCVLVGGTLGYDGADDALEKWILAGGIRRDGGVVAVGQFTIGGPGWLVDSRQGVEAGSEVLNPYTLLVGVDQIHGMAFLDALHPMVSVKQGQMTP